MIQKENTKKNVSSRLYFEGTLRLVADPGTSFWDDIEECKELAIRLRCVVAFVFNKNEFIIDADTDLKEMSYA